MKTLLISTALLSAPFLGAASAQTTTSTLTQLVSEQERQIQELKTEISSLRSLLNLERRNNGKVSLPASSTTQTVSTSSAKSHIVKAGDTFSSISRRYGVSVSALIVANPNVKPSKIAINHKLVIPQSNSKAVASAPRPAAITKPSPKTQTISTSGSYKVAKGDTFYGIARKHKISLAALSAANPGMDPSKLTIGQSLNLTKGAAKSSAQTTSKRSTSAYKPLPKVSKKTTTTSSPKVAAKPKAITKPTRKPAPTPAPKTEPESYVSQSGNVARTVPVRQEMTFGAFAKQHGTTITVLNALNGLDLPADEPMAAGSELFIPNK